MGSAAAYHLARRGQRVIGIEQHTPGHGRGSSYGESRAIRLSYFEHESYVPLVRRAYEGWRELERATGQTILTVTGILEAGHAGSVIVDGSLEASRLHGIFHEVLDAREIMRRFPAFHLPSGWHAVLQPDGGILNPDRAIPLLVQGASQAGATIAVGTRVLDILPGPSAVELRLDGRTIEAGHVIVAAGAWLGTLVPQMQKHLHVTRQVLGWFTPQNPELFTPQACPVFILDGLEDTCYGFPDFAGTGVKVASHKAGETVPHPDALRCETDAADEQQMRSCLAQFLSAANGALRRMSACMYTRTPDEDFIIDRHPADARIVIASPCSGHGFKFASVIGEILADLATTGSTAHDLSRFSLQRFAKAVR
jgi:sarcosine oxidase